MSKIVLALLILLTSHNVLARPSINYMCTHGDQQRQIDVTYENEHPTPCEVHYTKNGLSSVLWRAISEANYCEEKALGFIEKQKNWGWDCRTLNKKPSANHSPDTN